jgi:hypothetical protein
MVERWSPSWPHSSSSFVLSPPRTWEIQQGHIGISPPLAQVADAFRSGSIVRREDVQPEGMQVPSSSSCDQGGAKTGRLSSNAQLRAMHALLGGQLRPNRCLHRPPPRERSRKKASSLSDVMHPPWTMGLSLGVHSPPQTGRAPYPPPLKTGPSPTALWEEHWVSLHLHLHPPFPPPSHLPPPLC